jgi:proteic killer suppression protein
MIRSFRSKGLGRFFEAGDKGKIRPEHAPKLARILDRLDAATQPQDMNLPGYHFHQLTGDLSGHWAVSVSGNWRVTFRFDGEDATDVDYQDYH